MTPVQEIPVGLCKPAPTARAVKAGHVAELAESIGESGLIQPISVRAVVGGFEVIAGMHRLEAIKSLSWSTIPAIVRGDDDLHAELALIDENLIRNELSPAERSMAMSRRKQIYEVLHPEAKVGTNQHSRVRQVGEGSNKPPKAERFSKATAKATGASERAVQRDTSRGEALGAAVLARIVGTKLDTGEQIDALMKIEIDKRERIIAKAEAGEPVNAVQQVKADRRETREAELGQQQLGLPVGKFGVIYADPPWRFEVRSENGMDRAADNHYPTMETPDILAMKVPDIAADDCVLFLWATVPMLQEAMATMAAWGFTYKSHCIWAKDVQGTGYWFFNKHELLLVGTKGNIPAPTPGTQPVSVITAPVRDHSRKPIVFRAFIEKLFPTLPKVELFARTAADGWHQWGKEAPLSERALPAREEDIDGKEIVEKTPAEKREAQLMADAIVDAAGGEEMDIPAFLRRPQPERVG